jgi:hypothetical protein
VRKEDAGDPGLGGFTFKRWDLTEDGTRLSPVSRNPGFKPILLTSEEGKPAVTHIARFIEVLDGYDLADELASADGG